MPNNFSALSNCSPYSYRSFNYCNSDSCRSSSLIKSKGNFITIPFRARKSDNYCYRNISQRNNYRQRNEAKKAKKNKSNNFSRNNREKYTTHFDSTIIISHFGGTNFFFAHCIFLHGQYSMYYLPTYSFLYLQIQIKLFM